MTATSHVVLTRAGRTVHLRPRAGSGELRSALTLPGGSLTFAVDEPAAPPAAAVTDATVAAPWLHRVYGAETAASVAAWAQEDEDAARDPHPQAWSPSADAELLARLALGQWLWRYWPAADGIPSLDASLLRIELASLAWEADDCFGVLQPAGAYLRGELDALAAAAGRLADDAEADPDSLTAPAARAVLGALDALVVGEAAVPARAAPELLDELDELLTRIAVAGAASGTSAASGLSALTRASIDRLEAARREWSIRVRELDDAHRQDEYALAAGADPGALPHEIDGVGSVDWDQVPPRTLDWSDGTVSWTLENTGLQSWRMRIRVRAAPEPAATELFARCYVPDGTPVGELPAAVVPLNASGVEFIGEGMLSTVDPHALVVDVYAAESVHAPQLSEQSRAAGARLREAAREFVSRRASGADASPAGPHRRFEAESAGDAAVEADAANEAG